MKTQLQNIATRDAAAPKHGQWKRRGFTLIEILVVVTIILIMASLLFPLVAKVKRKARQNAAWMEVRQLESAWKGYLQDYVRPPTNTTMSVGVPFFRIEMDPVPIMGNIAAVLKGENTSGDNPRAKRYMVFQTLNDVGDPVNPWYADRRFRSNPEYLRYYVKFDADFNSVVNAGSGGEPANPPSTAVATSVIVWTHNPDLPLNHPQRIIGSWKK